MFILITLTLGISGTCGLSNNLIEIQNFTITTGNYSVTVPNLKINQQTKINDTNNLFLKSINDTITYINNNKLQNFTWQAHNLVAFIKSIITITGIGPVTYEIDIMSGHSGDEFKPNTIFQTTT
ncbi:hypothetical protein [Spiroplasma endosymbiont of Nebria brevicollis]|uniref:hypothetical protein n=1 Tax=Spiroplasma endosymbiont of Nebria brevicollis TaxID=3066284 RepID=UPI00313E46C0